MLQFLMIQFIGMKNQKWDQCQNFDSEVNSSKFKYFFQ
jgi:hypothetical protein